MICNEERAGGEGKDKRGRGREGGRDRIYEGRGAWDKGGVGILYAVEWGRGRERRGRGGKGERVRERAWRTKGEESGMGEGMAAGRDKRGE